MRILILNWRDPKNPESGGAEVLTHEMAKRWVVWGHTVTQVSALFAGAKEHESLDGVEIIRRGSGTIRSFHIPVHVAAYHWFQSHKDEFDVVIDEIHGIPYFTPWYIDQPIVALICEVAKEIWDLAFPMPINYIGRFIEQNYFRFYRNIPFLTISDSTRRELGSMGVSDNQITVLPMGLTLPKVKIRVKKEITPTLVYVGRLTRAKGVEDSLEAVSLIRQNIPSICLWIIGQGERAYVDFIKRQIHTRHMQKNVQLLDFVDNEVKFQYMARAHLLIVPSYKEGWGLTVPEAGIVGTPAIAYRVAGLQDVITDRANGILVTPTPRALASAVIKVLGSHSDYKKLSKAASAGAANYSWENTARVALSVLTRET